MWNIKIDVAAQEIFSSGSVVSIGNQAIVFRPLPAPLDSYKIEVVFEIGTAIAINWLIVEPSHFRIKLTNFFGVPWNATKAPIYVANNMGRKVFMHFASSTIGEGDSATRLFHYTFFDGGPVSG